MARIRTIKIESVMEVNCSQSKARAKVVLKAPASSVKWADTKLIDAGRKVKEENGTGRQDRVDPKERSRPKENGQPSVTGGTFLGTVPSGMAKRVVLRWIRGRLLNLFFTSVQSV